MTEENYLEVLTNKINSFCHQLVSSGLYRTRALAGLLLSMSSNTSASSVAELSLSPFFQHQYCSVYDAIENLVKDGETFEQARKIVLNLCLYWYIEEGRAEEFEDRIVLATDATPRPALFSSTLPDRQSIVMPNPTSHQPYNLSEGYNVSTIHLAHFADKWCVPLAMERIGIDETSSECARRQLTTLLANENLAGADTLIANAADNGYGNVPFLCPLYQQQPNLVNICRLKHGSKTFGSCPAPEDGTFRSQYYGDKAYNIMNSDVKMYKKVGKQEQYAVERASISAVPPDEQISYPRIMGRGQRNVTVSLTRWNGRLLEGKTGHSMKDKPVDIVRVLYEDALTGIPIYKREMYLVLSGKRRGEVTTRQAQEYYLSRSDIEAYYRTAKRRFLLDKYQTSNLRHFDNYLLVVQLATCLSYLSAKEATMNINPWERYLPQSKKPPEKRLTMSQAIRAATRGYATLDLRAFAPPKCIGGSGRKKGAKQAARERYGRVKKRKRKA